MKTTAKFLALLATGIVGTASAANVTIVITGSSAMRAPTHQSILNDLTTNGSGTALTYGYTGTSLGSATQAIFKRAYGADQLTVKTIWTGSVDGIRALASTGVTVAVLDDTVTTTTGGQSGLAAGTVAATANVAVADNLVASTSFVGTGFTALTSQPIAILPFKWVTNNGSPALNVTPQLVRALYGSGSLPKSLFTGVQTDDGATVYAYGRNFASGTRVIQLSETGYGVANPVSQYEAKTTTGDGVVGGTADVIATQGFTAAGTVLGESVAAGNNGYSSGGTLADILRRASGSGIGGTNAIILAPMGLDDANRCLANPGTTFNGPGTECLFNGVAYSEAAVKNGSYTFWSNAQLLYRTGQTGVVKTFADRVALNVTNVTAAIKLADMAVERFSDGGTVGAK